MSHSRELIVVMPVYNEAECIGAVIQDWHAALSDLKINFEIIALNDGSKDDTAQVLSVYANDERVTVINKANEGHGPTILQGYREAVARANWVFQVDSDDEMKPRAFPNFWRRRAKYDAIFGVRIAREQDSARRFLSAGFARHDQVSLRARRARCQRALPFAARPRSGADRRRDSRRNLRAQHFNFGRFGQTPPPRAEFAGLARKSQNRHRFAGEFQSLESRRARAMANREISDAVNVQMHSDL